MATACCEDLGRLFRTDAEAVCFAASLLDISEFKLFEIAHVNWFGREASNKDVEGFFGNYLKSGFVPFWLRDTVRKIISKYRNGNLAPSEFGIEISHVSHSERKFGWILIGLIGLLVFCISWISTRPEPHLWQ
jgi:hypothetical protein